jgi:hypothetical protein
MSQLLADNSIAYAIKFGARPWTVVWRNKGKMTSVQGRRT